jgi:hypothetical protein
MALVVDGGGLVNKGGALGTGQACCCNKCSGPCDEENPCTPGCVCDYTNATAAYRCIINGAVDPSLTSEAACEECVTECDSEGCTSTGNCGQWTQYPIGNCVAAPNCCEDQNVQLQITLEISGLADGTLTGCGCLDGTYVADVIPWIEWPGTSQSSNPFGAKLLLQPGCVATDANGGTVPGQIFLEWHCNGYYALADWGFKPPMAGDYPPSDQMRLSFLDGVSCVGGESDDPDYFVSGGEYRNPFFTGCDTSGLYAKVTIQ